MRARETWEQMKPVLGEHIPVTWRHSLYLAGASRALELLYEAGSTRTVALVGHNPGWEDLLHRLSGQSERLTTCNAALLESDAGSWREAVESPWSLRAVLRPRTPRS